jgi:DNA-binding LacI/PurR family transcriptional regulator
LNSKEFAKIIGVSQSTISRALNDSDLVSEEKKLYIRQKAIELGFVLNSQARSLKTNRTGNVGILFPKHFIGMHTNMTLSYLYDSIQKVLFKFGYDVMVINDYGDLENIPVFERMVKQHKVDGFIILRRDLTEKEEELIRLYDIPYIYFLNVSSTSMDSDYCIADSEYGGWLAGSYLGQFKDYEMFYVDATEKNTDSKDRIEGYRRGLKESGCFLHPENIVECKLSISDAYACIIRQKHKFCSRKTAIFAYNDMVAFSAVNACKDMGLKIPEEVQIIGLGDIPLASTLVPRISTIRIQIEEMAVIGCEILCNGIERKKMQNRQVKLKPELVLRETTL